MFGFLSTVGPDEANCANIIEDAAPQQRIAIIKTWAAYVAITAPFQTTHVMFRLGTVVAVPEDAPEGVGVGPGRAMVVSDGVGAVHDNEETWALQSQTPNPHGKAIRQAYAALAADRIALGQPKKVFIARDNPAEFQWLTRPAGHQASDMRAVARIYNLCDSIQTTTPSQRLALDKKYPRAVGVIRVGENGETEANRNNALWYSPEADENWVTRQFSRAEAAPVTMMWDAERIADTIEAVACLFKARAEAAAPTAPYVMFSAGTLVRIGPNDPGLAGFPRDTRSFIVGNTGRVYNAAETYAQQQRAPKAIRSAVRRAYWHVVTQRRDVTSVSIIAPYNVEHSLWLASVAPEDPFGSAAVVLAEKTTDEAGSVVRMALAFQEADHHYPEVAAVFMPDGATWVWNRAAQRFVGA
jgi:hypothetical protein